MVIEKIVGYIHCFFKSPAFLLNNSTIYSKSLACPKFDLNKENSTRRQFYKSNIHIYIYIYIMVCTTEGFFRSSYRKFTRVGFKPATTEFSSESLSDWAIRPWVQLALRANFVQLLQFHLFVQRSRCISVFVVVHICNDIQ